MKLNRRNFLKGITGLIGVGVLIPLVPSVLRAEDIQPVSTPVNVPAYGNSGEPRLMSGRVEKCMNRMMYQVSWTYDTPQHERIYYAEEWAAMDVYKHKWTENDLLRMTRLRAVKAMKRYL